MTEALQAFRDTNRPATKPTEGTRPDPAAQQAEWAAALKTRLDQAVTDGKLTSLRRMLSPRQWKKV